MSKPKMILLVHSLVMICGTFEKASKETYSFSKGISVIRENKPSKANKQKSSKNNKSKIKSFSNKLVNKPNSVKKNFNSRRL